MKTLTTLILALILGIVISISCISKNPSESTLDYTALVDSIPSMTKVNDFPVALSDMMITSCRMPTKSEQARKNSPHVGENFGSRYINVYVNEIGLAAMTLEKNPKFPKGSLIIKEKFNPNSANTEIELYTIMLKRKTGYNPKCGDWEFISVDGNLKEHAAGKLENCMGCHQSVPETDFVFREEYLGIEHKQSIYDYGLSLTKENLIQFKSDELVKSYSRLCNAKTDAETQEHEQAFFQAFPNSFNEMEQMFGYSEKNGPAPLYLYGRAIIHNFSQLNTISDSLYFDKYIRININGN